MRLLWNSYTRNVVLFLLRLLPISKGQIIFICWGGSKYSCNPKAISDEILKRHDGNLRMYYAFEVPDLFESYLPSQINLTEIGGLEYFKLLATSQFIVSNVRIAGYRWPFPKRKGQYYIQTMHGGHGIKKVELDVKESLPKEYIKCAIEDTKRTDLMLSDSKYWTNVYRTAYRYSGEILEKGLPRNDIFFSDVNTKRALKSAMFSFIKEKKSNIMIDESTRFLIYTPTFRGNGRKDVYGFDIDRVVKALELRFGGIWYILVSCHPNMLSYYHEIYDFSHSRLIDVGDFPELQDLLVVCDALITDYSSAEMDFSLTERPIFQLIRDRDDYDRGTYLDPRSLPFPYAENDDKLCDNISKFDNETYLAELKCFNESIITLNETGNASKYVVDWIYKHL